MKQYTFSNGYVMTSKLEADEVLRRLDRLDWLRVMTEGFEEGVGYSICQKALRAYKKSEDFNGIIRLTLTEKDFLGFILEENEYLNENEKEVLRFYIG